MRARIPDLTFPALVMAAVAAFTQSAAQSPSASMSTKVVIAADKSSAGYRAGFMDGCEHATMGNPRNEARFNRDVNYHEGWASGFKNCYPHQTINTNNDPNGPLKGLF